MELNNITTTTNSSKVYVRNYDYRAYYEIDRVMPRVLDTEANGGIPIAGMSNEDWIRFCDKIDSGFEKLNTFQSINFYCDLIVGLVVLFYVMLCYILFIFPSSFKLVYLVIVIAGSNILFRLYVQGCGNTSGIRMAKKTCDEETARLNLRARHDTTINIVWHYRKRRCVDCEGYESDSNERNRYPEIFIEITVTGPSMTTTAIGYGVDVEREETTTAIAIDECYSSNGLEDTPVATAIEMETDRVGLALYQPRTGAMMEPYVTIPMASASLYTTSNDADTTANTSA